MKHEKVWAAIRKEQDRQLREARKLNESHELATVIRAAIHAELYAALANISDDLLKGVVE